MLRRLEYASGQSQSGAARPMVLVRLVVDVKGAGAAGAVAG